jgi:hypothetical protein
MCRVDVIQVSFFFPLKPFVKALFARADLVPYLLHDSTVSIVPAGHATKSRGFKEKVIDNPVMNKDHRSLGLCGTTDGVPFFDDQKRGAWPFILRVVNLPDGLSHHTSNSHLHLLQASEFWEMDEEANVLRRTVRAPKSLKAHMAIIVDDLLHAYTRGIKATDASVPVGCPGRVFRCHAALLYWTGDYPAQAAVSGMHSKCCHWCTMKSKPAPEVTRRLFNEFRRYLRKSPKLHTFLTCPT